MIFDLRNHGESSKHVEPFTTASAALDISLALDRLMLEPHAIIGHSFGGKVAALAASTIPSTKQLWLLDSSFGKLAHVKALEAEHKATAINVLEVLEELSWPFASRRMVSEALKAKGLSQQIALWMTTNLVEDGDGFRLNFSPSELRLMLLDFVGLDLWPLAKELSASMAIHLVKAEIGSRLDEDDEQKLKGLENNHYFHVLKNSGHFVQADNPAGLIALMNPFFA